MFFCDICDIPECHKMSQKNLWLVQTRLCFMFWIRLGTTVIFVPNWMNMPWLPWMNVHRPCWHRAPRRRNISECPRIAAPCRWHLLRCSCLSSLTHMRSRPLRFAHSAPQRHRSLRSATHLPTSYLLFHWLGPVTEPIYIHIRVHTHTLAHVCTHTYTHKLTLFSWCALRYVYNSALCLSAFVRCSGWVDIRQDGSSRVERSQRSVIWWYLLLEYSDWRDFLVSITHARLLL